MKWSKNSDKEKSLKLLTPKPESKVKAAAKRPLPHLTHASKLRQEQSGGAALQQ